MIASIVDWVIDAFIDKNEKKYKNKFSNQISLGKTKPFGYLKAFCLCLF